MLGLVMEDCRTNRVELLPSHEEAARANAWKGKKVGQNRERVRFFRSLAAHLAQDEIPGFVVVHIDADTVWSEFDSSENRSRFEGDFVQQVMSALQHARDTGKRGDLDVDARIKRLVPIFPCYSIESWLYQNTSVAAKECQRRGRSEDARQVKHWGRNRHELDEVDKPKAKLCLGSSHNRPLAETAFPADKVAAARKSFHHAVETLREASGLVGALEESLTYSPLT